MKNVFLDTNVLIDYLTRRKEFFEPAACIVQLGVNGKVNLLVSALSFATASFILEAHYKIPKNVIVQKFADFVRMCNVTPVDSITIDESIASDFSDFEDAMQYYSALRGQANAIITRNVCDFATAQISVYEPKAFLDMLTAI